MVTQHMVQEIFSQYGTLSSVWVATNPAGFAFVEYEDPACAREAIQEMDGELINGVKVRVESTGANKGSRISHWGGRDDR